MNELIQPILALGGLGYVNYIFYDRISDRNFGTNTDRKFFIGAMSSINYFLYLICYTFLGNLIVSVFCAVLLSFALTIKLPEIVRLSFKFTNRIRNEKNMAEQVPEKVFDTSFGKNNMQRVFIFSVPDNILISKGYKEYVSGENEDVSMIVAPLTWNDEASSVKTEEDLNDFLDNKNLESRTYFNFEKKLKIIYFSV